MKFKELGLNDDILESLHYMNFEEATPIQEKAIPVILNGKDLIACAQTGTGKTAAFILPLVQEIAKMKEKGTKALVIAPTRELAQQIDQQIQGLAYFSGISSCAVYGGGGKEDWIEQKKALTGGADIVVATPGKLQSHINVKNVDFSQLKYLILDEADRMLDIGFFDDIMQIIDHLPKKRQTLMFSATMASKIRKLANKILKNPEEITLKISKPAEGVLQAAYYVHDNQKLKLLQYLINDKPQYESILIFCSTKKKVDQVARALSTHKYTVEQISSDLEQEDREKVLQNFQSRKTRVLVGTDVVSRGIDIKDINIVINYDVPRDPEDYVHRIGRTARAKSTGVGLTFVNNRDKGALKKIERLIEKEVPKAPLPKGMGKGPKSNKRGKNNRGRKHSKSKKR
jgi:superfamily II DNA/RNA helicase